MSQSPFFLGRTQEQDQFRRVLEQYAPASLAQKYVPTFASWVGQAPKLPDEPYIFLFHGPGGMGKTTLTRRLRDLATKEFKGKYQTVFIDWDQQRDLNSALRQGHGAIEPQTVLDVLHKELQPLKFYTGETYSQVRQDIQTAETAIEQALDSEPPNTELKDETAKYGGKIIAAILRHSTEGVITADPMGVAVGLKVGATLLNQTRQLIKRTALSKEQIESFQQPLEKLVAGLANDIVKATQQQPTIVFLDTYEIIDRQLCDYTLRKVIQQGGSRAIWAISGRSNLSKSGKRGETYFRGYADDFSEAQIYPRELLQFSFREIQEYFKEKVPEVSLTETDAESIAEFSLGIPFVVDLAAVMCSKGKPISEIVAPLSRDDGEANDRDQVITQTCERFLKHCLYTPETLPDRQLTFALAMMRRSQMDLLGAMVDVPTGLREKLKALQGQYAFLAEDEQRLDEKMANFMQDYLLQDLQRQDSIVQQLNDNAIAWLELQIEERQETLSDTTEHFEDERLAGWILDLAHHYSWRGEDALSDYLVPRFIEAWQYNRTWAKSLLQVVEPFRRLLTGANRRLLNRMVGVLETKPDLEEMAILLETLDKRLTRQTLNAAKVQELKAILQLYRGHYLYLAEQYDEALIYSLNIADELKQSVKLTNATSRLLENLGFKLGWQKKYNAVASIDAKQAFEKAIQLYSNNARAHFGLGVMQLKFKDYELALQFLKRSIDLRDGQYAAALNSLGNTYKAIQQYEEAIESYSKAIELDPSYALAHNNLGNTYRAQQRYEDAAKSYSEAIELDPSYAAAYTNLGGIYAVKQQYEDAVESYSKAIELDPSDDAAYINLGRIYALQQQYEAAIANYQKAVDLDPNNPGCYLNLANTLVYHGPD